ncbi:TetR family transcriptional regulator [Fluviicoccus keumensis]|uniref:TetR family transcriptional regulator n=1 Tax=Fluviicoccus keumensis TaxID=1435465 RepID=A0A4Q7YMU1_9GAMM|nr:TetR/AcrR family transcriptional regulator [Fluviicoccus keumensis]RZU38700.1 TetR family transcriptional regulator [Fluviicoccus keumensis]
MTDAAPAPRPYAGETPEARRARRRRCFIDSGKILFGTVGYRKTTMRGLCAHAGLTDRYFYESFASLEDLLAAVYEERAAELEAAVLAAVRATGPDAPLDTLIRHGLDAFFRQAEDAETARVIWLEVLGVSPRIDTLYNGVLRRFADLMLLLIRLTLPEWDVSGNTARVLAMGLIGAVSESAKDWLMTGYTQPRAELVAGVALLFEAVARLPKAA